MDSLLNDLLKNGILDETVICRIKAMKDQEYYELKHFCLQYNEWKRELSRLNWFGEKGDGRLSDVAKPVEWLAVRREEYLKKMEMIEQAAIEADSDIYEYLVKGVTQGITYSRLRADGLLCSRDYYCQYRRFFYCLSHLRR